MRVREDLLRAIGGSKTVVDLAAPVTADAAASDRDVVFRSGDFVSEVPATTAAALDVRDKAELAALRNARKRDVILWRVVIGMVAGILLLGLGELALVGGRQWLGLRNKEYAAKKPLVDKVMSLHELANRIDDIATKRLLPIEMVTAAAIAKPGDVFFSSAQTERTRGLYTLVVRAYTMNSAQVNAYEAALRALPTVESATATIERMGNDRTNFVMTIVFKPDALKPAGNAPAAATVEAPKPATPAKS